MTGGELVAGGAKLPFWDAKQPYLPGDRVIVCGDRDCGVYEARYAHTGQSPVASSRKPVAVWRMLGVWRLGSDE